MKREATSQDGTLPFPWIYPEPETVQPSKAKANVNVASKPSNYHSKFTGKCGGKPQCPKDKTLKGTQKCRKRDMVVSPGLITWRVVDRRLGLNFSGFSATGILEHLYDDDVDVNEDIDEIGNHVNNDADHDDGVPCGLFDDDYMANFWSLLEKKDDDDDGMSYCDVGFMMDQTEEDEDWCLLREI